MIRPWLTFVAMCSVVLGIVLFCVVFGGYSSFYRSQNRIAASKELVTNVCQDRVAAISRLLEAVDAGKYQELMDIIKKDSEAASTIRQQVISHGSPLSEELTRVFETSQKVLTTDLADLMSRLGQTGDKNTGEPVASIQKEVFTAQDNLFVAKKKYNSEVGYFTARKTIFPGRLIAKLFGFNTITYFELSDESFLPAAKAFNR